ncbi:MAG: tRNA-dihydrouridine synthase family protein, partial [Clostridia bacterium]|nr:tRNA-dihydrouridine synthase family protein [Clostridia bacterium]
MKRTVMIGQVRVEGYAALAPMAGFGDAAFRSVCREEGACLTTSEMVSAKGLCYGGQVSKTRELMLPFENETPYAVQLFGSDPAILAEGARIALETAKPDLIDRNMGCPVPKVAGNGEGCALMKDP